jgi:phenylalanyl-tRNA synthetase beta chain
VLETNNLLEISNPLQKENKFLRNSLIPGLLKAVAKNPAFDQTFLFEIGNIFDKNEEKTVLAFVSAGKKAKNALDEVIEKICSLTSIDRNVIKIKEIAQVELQRYKIKKPVAYAAEVQISDLMKNVKLTDDYQLKIPDDGISYRQVSRFPSVTRDLAFIVNADIDAVQVEKAILEASESVLLTEVFDEFTSAQFGENKKNIALHLWLQDLNKTITDEEIAQIMQVIINHIEKKFDAKIRG